MPELSEAVFDSGRGRRPPDGGFPHQCDRQFLLRQRGGLGGSVVNMSSAAARHGGMPNEAHYAASKGAIYSFTLSLAKELAPHGIRVNAVRPGLIATEVHEVHGGQALLDKIGPTVPEPLTRWPRWWLFSPAPYRAICTARWSMCLAVAEFLP